MWGPKGPRAPKDLAWLGLDWLGLACPWRRWQPFRQRRRQQLRPQREQPQAPPSAARGCFAPLLWLFLLRRQADDADEEAADDAKGKASQAKLNIRDISDVGGPISDEMGPTSELKMQSAS